MAVNKHPIIDYPSTPGAGGYTAPKGFNGAFRKGQAAFWTGTTPKRLCPYRDHRTAYGSVTFSRAWAKFWMEGWEYARLGRMPTEKETFARHDLAKYANPKQHIRP